MILWQRNIAISCVFSFNPWDNFNGLVNKFMSRCYQLWYRKMPLPILLGMFIYTHTLPPAKRCHTLMKLFEYRGTLLGNSARLLGDAMLTDICHQIMIRDVLNSRCREWRRVFSSCMDLPSWAPSRAKLHLCVARLGCSSSSANLRGNASGLCLKQESVRLAMALYRNAIVNTWCLHFWGKLAY